MEVHPFTSFNLLTVSLPLLVLLLLFWVTSITTIAPPSPPPLSVSVFSAAQLLRAHGYSLFANALVSESYRNSNLSGTILAPSDFAFSFATAKFSSVPLSHAPHRPSAALLHYHTLQIPSLNWFNLNARPDGDELPTNYKNNYCLFLFRDENGDPALSSSKKRMRVVTIRHPDLYTDDTLTIHGVDGVLDPTAAKKCSFSTSKIHPSPTAGIQSPVDRSFLDHSIRVLRIRGFNVVASAMALRWSVLLTVKAATIFAPSDTALFAVPHGFRYDFLHHIIPRRLRSGENGTFPKGGLFETLAPDKAVFVQFGDKDIRINGVRAAGGELYHNRWIVIYPISVTLDDAIDQYPSTSPENHFPDAGEIGNVIPIASPGSSSELTGGPSPFPPERDILSEEVHKVPTVAPVSDQRCQHDITGKLLEPPLLSPETFLPTKTVSEHPEITQTSGTGPVGSPCLSPESQIPVVPAPETPVFAPTSGQTRIPAVTGKSTWTPSPAPNNDEVFEMHCKTEGPNNMVQALQGITVEIDGGDLFCPASNVPDL